MVFDACINWARKNCEATGMDGTIAAHLRAALGDAFYKIRFCAMAVEQFAEISEMHAELLSSEESIEVFKTIVLKQSGKTSSIFGENNSKTREPIMLDLECSFGRGFLNEVISVLTEYSHTLKFDCDKDVYLNGFVVCYRMDVDSIVVKVQGIERTCTKILSDNETKIIFNEPFRVTANKLQMIDISCTRNSQSPICWRWSRLEELIQQNGILFDFRSCCNARKSITRLLFNIIP